MYSSKGKRNTRRGSSLMEEMVLFRILMNLDASEENMDSVKCDSEDRLQATTGRVWNEQVAKISRDLK